MVPVIISVALCLSIFSTAAQGAPQQKVAPAAGTKEEDPSSSAPVVDPTVNAKYTIITHKSVRPAHRTDFIAMTDKTGKVFECVLPTQATADQDAEHDAKVAEEPEEPTKLPSLDSMLEPLSGRCFLRNEGYWNIELCHKKKLRQFHEEGKKTAVEYSLGEFDRAEAPTEEELKQNPKAAVLRHFYEGGTRCDETDSPRKTMVEYRCVTGKENHIQVVKETSACNYTLHFTTPLLCKHPLLAPAVQGKGVTKVMDYLSGLSGSCFYRVEGWWTYEFCYQKHFKQFHQENNANTAEFMLGLYAAENAAGDGSKDIHVDDGSKQEVAYYRQQYTRGTKCDVTGEARVTEVQFKCATDSLNVVASVKEKATCSYIVVFYTPLICNHPAFQQKQDPVRSIQCYPAPAPAGEQPLLT